ncbi:MAG: hypothetical protein JWO44_935 [Bacteroidetes bacterium]|nr:hypothetical protein [Bacteroidota bacterium]
MKNFRLTYLFFSSFTLASLCGYSQNNEATVTIVGNPVDNDPTGNQFSNINYQTNAPPPPPAQQEFAPVNENIEPTLENGFHMRFQIESPGSVERLSGAGTSTPSSSGSYYSAGSGGGSGAKVRKRAISMTERSFNFKKKLKNWMPKRKKKYHPTLCEKFR